MIKIRLDLLELFTEDCRYFFAGHGVDTSLNVSLLFVAAGRSLRLTLIPANYSPYMSEDYVTKPSQPSPNSPNL